MDTVNAWNQIIEQSPLFAFMAIVIYFGAKYIARQNEKNEARENKLAENYNIMVDKLISLKTEETAQMVNIIAANTEVMRRVERKLDE